MPPVWLKAYRDGVTLAILAQPNAKRSELVGETQGCLKIKVASPPVDGAANEALREFLSRRLKVRISQVDLLKGERSRQKVFFIKGLSLEEVQMRLGNFSEV